jgi:hypothetical protein
MNDFDLGRSIAEITLGIDALERASGAGRGALDTEGLVPIFMGTDLVAPRAFADWSAAHAALDEVEPGITALPEGPRKTFLRSMTRSLRAATRLFAGEPLDFATKLTDLVGVPAEPVPDATVAAIHARLEALLRARGYTSGTLGERVRTWERERYLEADALPKVFEELMAVAKRRTDESIFDTRDYTMALNPMRGVPYTARCAFNDGNMDINLDVSFTRSALKHLVCHEVFPGHSTQLLYTRAKAERGESPLDALLCTTNAVTGCVQEGIGDQGIELIDWVEDEDDAAHIEIRRLQTACGTNAAWYLMTGAWTRDEAAQYLRDNAFAQEAWINGRLAMAQHPFRGAFVASYWFGTEAVRTVRERTAPADRPAFLKYLYEGLHSPESLLMFAA